MGTSVEPWALDNARPAHLVHVPAFRIDAFPVSNAQYQTFVAGGGYDDPRWWTAEGWRHRQRADLSAPQDWVRDGDRWWRVRFGSHEPVPPDEPRPPGDPRQGVGRGGADGVAAGRRGECAQGVEHRALAARAGVAGGGGLEELDVGVQGGLEALRGQRHVVGGQDVLGVDVLGVREGHAGPRVREDEVLEGQPRRPGHE